MTGAQLAKRHMANFVFKIQQILMGILEVWDFFHCQQDYVSIGSVADGIFVSAGTQLNEM